MDGRWTRPEDWYTYLQVTPEEIAEQCYARGWKDAEVQDIIRSWGTRLYRGARRSRPAGREETLKDPYAEEIPNLAAIYRYDREVEKPAAAEVFTGCLLDDNAQPETIRAFDKFKCQEILCNDDVEDSAGVMRRRKVRNPGQMPEVAAANPANRHIYQHCQRVGETHCKSSGNIELVIDPAVVTHVPNPGIGDCLFIAVANYEHMARQLPGGEYITPDSPAARAVPDGSIVSATYLNSGAYKKDSMVIDERQKRLRAQVIEWFKANADAPYPSSVIFGLSVREELARTCVDAENSGAPFGFKAGLSACKMNHPGAMATLVQLHRVIDGFTAMSIIQEKVGRDAKYLAARAALVDCLFKAYVKEMSKQTTYGGQPEIAALSQILDKNIYVLQKNSSGMLTANFGMVEEGRSNIYILHKASVEGRGSLHYEVVFPVTPEKFRKPEGFALSNVLRPLGGPGRTIINSPSYERLAEGYLNSLKGDDINMVAMAMAYAIKTLSSHERAIAINWFKNKFAPYLTGHEELHPIWIEILTGIDDEELKNILAEEQEDEDDAEREGSEESLRNNALVKKILATDISRFQKYGRIPEYITAFLKEYNRGAISTKRVPVVNPVHGSVDYEKDSAKNLESMKIAAGYLGNVRAADKIQLREAIRAILLSWLVTNEELLKQHGMILSLTEEGLKLTALLVTIEKIMEKFDI
jgi:hypothetical protein